MEFSKCHIVNPRIALVVMAIFSLFSGATVTYISAVLTTLEKRFEFNSMEMGFIMGANDIGYLTSVIFVTYFGSKNNRQPFMLFLSGLGLWISCMGYTLPYYIYGSKFSAESLVNLNVTKGRGLCLNNTLSLTSVKPGERISSEIKLREKSLALFIFMITGIINGIASTPFWCLGISFLDDLVGPAKSGIYIGTLYAMRTCSPLLGFSLGSHVLKYHESLKIMVHQYYPGQTDLKWIGAWWLGWLIFGFCVLIPSPIMTLIRKKKQKNDDQTQTVELLESIDHADKENNETQINADNSISSSKRDSPKEEKVSIFKMNDLLEIFHILKETIRNRIFNCLVIGMIFEFVSFISLLTFFTKYLEYHFRVSASTANIMSAFCLAGSSMISSTISGITSIVYKTTVRNMGGFHAIVNTIAALIFPILFIFTCPSTHISGLDEASKIAMCSDKCICQIKKLSPICFNATTYFSPCIAGCTKRLNETFYSNCGCQTAEFAVKGFCEKMCLSVYGFLILYGIIRVVGSIGYVQFTQIIMRLANPKFKAMNLSIISFIYGVCGLALPPLAGLVLDTACTYRNVNKYGLKSNCLIYDNDKMRYMILGIAFVFQIPACVFYIISWLSTPVNYVNEYLTETNNASKSGVDLQSTNTTTEK